MKEFLKYLAAGLLVALVWAVAGGIEWQSPGDRTEAAQARAEVQRLRSRIESNQHAGQVAVDVEDLRKAEERLKELEP